MNDPTAPLSDTVIDVRDLDGFMLNAERLLASELWALSTGEEFKAAMGLWCRAWKQIPAGSLPNDERVLASFAHVTPARWKKIRDVALRGFVLCSDGRLYHRVLCEDAKRAFAMKQSRKEERDGDIERKRREREDRASMFERLRAVGIVPEWNATTRDLRGLITLHVTAPVTRDKAYQSHGRSRCGQGQGQGQENTTPPPPSVVSPREGTPDSPAAAATALAKRVKGVDSQEVRKAIEQGHALGVVQAFGGNLTGDRPSEWSRDTDGLQIGVLALLFAWARWQGKPIREPSGLRKARAAWSDLSKDTRQSFNDLLEEYGISTGAEAL